LPVARHRRGLHLRAGVDCIEHGVLIDAEAIAMMKERGVPLVPTVYVLDYIIEQGRPH
jgi:imidazolonepropionase-like amidohydrolase